MAKKTSVKKKEAAAAPKAAAKKTPKKAAAAPAPAAPAPAPEASAKPAEKAPKAPKAKAPKAPAAEKAPKAAKPKAAPVKLTASQTEALKKIGEAGEAGYKLSKKTEQKTLDALKEKKLIKAGKKDKTDDKIPYIVSSAGKKHLDSAPKS